MLISYNIGLKGNFFRKKKIWENEVQRTNTLSPDIRPDDQKEESVTWLKAKRRKLNFHDNKFLRRRLYVRRTKEFQKLLKKLINIKYL